MFLLSGFGNVLMMMASGESLFVLSSAVEICSLVITKSSPIAFGSTEINSAVKKNCFKH